MKKELIIVNPLEFPREFRSLINQAQAVYDTSSSPQARVYFIDTKQGYFLKRAKLGSLQKEAELTMYFFQKGLAQEVISYLSEGEDWLLTAKVDGKDASSECYLADPKHLCHILAKSMRALHDMKPVDGLLPQKISSYLKEVEEGYKQGRFSPDYLLSHQKHETAEQAYQQVQEFSKLLKSDTIVHGDFCLPNLILKDWKFEAFIDWDHAGLGDKHIDLYWVLWSLKRNLGTDIYRDYFLDCYGRGNVNMPLLEAISYFEVFG
ncbi:aminoglycoside 3'-phosphotransferase [Streptococcus gallolyticus]|uniref:aminoglycoside 3'-phosphotransferase n=1 Tax=Streptococcus hepaticus TaxID=3349163 RepID=UPI001C958805|nr:aminoglycoside 3'-phosphotransferase [Streptococcus gallolyticus]MBY5040142.1 aminoglycoside 3'-phosphotransferase [Streptococcus gallolyticus]